LSRHFSSLLFLGRILNQAEAEAAFPNMTPEAAASFAEAAVSVNATHAVSKHTTPYVQYLYARTRTRTLLRLVGAC